MVTFYNYLGLSTRANQGAGPKSTTGSTFNSNPQVGNGTLTDSDCAICLSKLNKPTELPCRHKFCKDCLDQAKKAQGPTCPVCKHVFGVIIGNMPKGTMTHRFDVYRDIPGYPRVGCIVITYYFADGKQGKNHPNPGKRYTGTTRTAYLPNTTEGQKVLSLLKTAFDRQLTFTIGTSRTTGLTDMVTWNDIHHKTSIHGGPQNFGYPDPDYLSRVKEELAAKGVK
ncbi:probable E3 ubiquitin-protein ligase DTX3 [Ptychodera flava]|uniref:probable E3 ubiquitin-protein ligase DTX3 n=1 Tax=Ptychodera flava TaxID=63121 RepID=UPI00396A22B6